MVTWVKKGGIPGVHRVWFVSATYVKGHLPYHFL